MLKKKNNSIPYHVVKEEVAHEELITGHAPSDTNVSDLLMNHMPTGQTRTCYFRGVVYYA